MLCEYFEGENIKPVNSADAKALIGKDVIYLQECDIDKSGRGYYFPRNGKIVAVKGKNIAIDHEENFCVYLSNVREMVLA